MNFPPELLAIKKKKLYKIDPCQKKNGYGYIQVGF